MNEKILIVDDEEDVIEVVGMLLEVQNYEVLKAYNGKEGVKKAYEGKPDLVLLDIMMPEMDGVEACKKMRELEGMKDIPIVMFSAKMSTIDKKEAFDAGADGFITKPFNAKGFLSGIKTYLELGRMN